jgi:hypothetical protein
MTPKPPRFTKGKGHEKLNRALDARLRDVIGDGYILVNRVGDTATIRLSIDRLIARIPKTTGIRWGKAVSDVTAGNTVTLTPCAPPPDGTAIEGASNVTIHLTIPVTYSFPADTVAISTDDVLAYFPFNLSSGEADGVLVSVPLNFASCTD